MRRLRCIAILLPVALVAFLIGPPPGQSQPPRGLDGGRGGDRGTGGRGMGGRGMMMDPEQMFERLSNGGSTMRIADMERGREFAEEWARGKGITNGQLTREQYL